MRLLTYGPEVPQWAIQTFEQFTRMVAQRLSAPFLLWNPSTAAQLPAASAANAGALAYEADRGLVVSNGSAWVGAPATGTAVVDFGSTGATDASASVAATAIATGSVARATILANASPDHSADEHRVEEIDVMAGNVQAGVGFSIFAKTRNFPLFGKWNVAWEWA